MNFNRKVPQVRRLVAASSHSRNLLSHKRQDWLSEDGQEGKGFGPFVTSAVHDRMPVILDPDAYDV